VTAPAQFFGGNSDGALRMERWLDWMCADCVHGENVDGLAGMGCDFPARAYSDPYDDIAEWSTDAARIPRALGGLLCMQHESRPIPVADRKPPPEVPGQLALTPEDVR
jgi:hypothetical protein